MARGPAAAEGVKNDLNQMFQTQAGVEGFFGVKPGPEPVEPPPPEIPTPKKLAKNFDDYRDLFTKLEQPLPLPLSAYDWRENSDFSKQRLQGPQPNKIEKADAAAVAKFAALSTPEYAELNAEVQKALAAGQLLICDYSAFMGMKGSYEGGKEKFVTPAMALFRVTQDKAWYDRMPIEPLAIQLEQDEQNSPYPIFTPDLGNTWEIAKAAFTAADGSYYQQVAHLGETHMVVEAFIPATHRQLAPLHPLHLLLVPHFEGTCLINFGATKSLLQPGGVTDLIVSNSNASMQALMTEKILARLGRDFSHPAEVKARGMDKANFPHRYMYRDCGQLHWDALHDWVRNYLQIYYGSTKEEQKSAIAADNELKDFVAELISQKGGKVGWLEKEWAGSDDQFALLVKVTTAVIYTASVMHAAVNFPQITTTCFAPAYPFSCYAPIPTDTSERPGSAIFDILPDLDSAVLGKTVSLLGGVGFGVLGRYRPGHFADERVAPVLQSYHEALASIGETIEGMNAEINDAWDDTPYGRKRSEAMQYQILNPPDIPQSIK
ncbi:unnamed protein product [Chrysoparadoxa australica]